mmetsp:Transcript_19822/g.62946  ORF Transcript_19822/g.62946 Transcript_19822/m.62946 type:complete len:167 (-) Transcript_19822:62-562(-)
MKKWAVDLDTGYSGKLEEIGQISATKEVLEWQRKHQGADRNEAKTIARRARDIAHGPAKNVLTTMLMMWLSGSSLNIFTIMIVLGMGVWTPLRSLLSVGAAFSALDGKGISLAQFKARYLLLNLAVLGIGLWKCNSIGLLPVKSSDWITLIPDFQAAELSAPAITL